MYTSISIIDRIRFMDKEERRKLALALFISVSIVLGAILISWFIIYQNSIDPDSVRVGRSKLFLTLEEIQEPTTINLETSYLVSSEEYDLADILLEPITSKIKSLETINELYSLFETMNEYTETTSLKEIEIPAKAGYIGIEGTELPKDILREIKNSLPYFDFSIFQSEAHIYQWNTSYKLNKGTEINESHYIILLNNNYVYMKLKFIGDIKGSEQIIIGEIQE